LIEPNVDALGHADDECSPNQVDGELGSGFQDDGRDAGTGSGQHAEDGEEQFQFDPVLAVLNKYLLDDNLVVTGLVGDDGRAASVERLLIFREKRPFEPGDQVLALFAKLRVLPDVQHFPVASRPVLPDSNSPNL